MKCNKCNNEIPDNSKFCLHCGTKVEVTDEKVCPKCGNKNPLDARFCTDCGTRFRNPNCIENENSHERKMEIDIDPIVLRQQEDERQKELVQCRLIVKQLYVDYKDGYDLLAKSYVIPCYSGLMNLAECHVVIGKAQRIMDEDGMQKQKAKKEKLTMVKNELSNLNELFTSNDAHALFTPQEVYDKFLMVKAKCQEMDLTLDLSLGKRISLLYEKASYRNVCNRKFIKSRLQAERYLCQFITSNYFKSSNSLGYLDVDVVSLQGRILHDFNSRITFDRTTTYQVALDRIYEGCKLDFRY